MNLPDEVQLIITTLRQAGFTGYAVGGCVRDLLLGREPQDWDVTTNAQPEAIQKLFPNNFYNNRFGTVTVLPAQIEVTTYRVEADYTDQRHPDSIKFTDKLEDDLARRDFTINAMALSGTEIIDPFDGQSDLKQQLIRAVGKPSERFAEDALRLLRAVRLAAQLDFVIESATLQAIKEYAPSITAISHERVRDELVKIVMSDHPEYGFNILEGTGLLAHILPELQEGVGVGQNKHHIYTVFDHSVKSAQYAANYDYSLPIRLAALLHDIGKPRTKRPQGNDFTFYAHEIVGAHMAEKLLKRLHFSNDMIKHVVHLIRQHMFYYDVGKVTEAGMRRLLKRVGPEYFEDLIKLRIAERKGSGVPKAEPYRLRHLQFLAEKVSQQAISTSQLAINGNDLMKELGLKPGPQIGGILGALLADVIDHPTHNSRDYLLSKAQELQNSDPQQLKALGVEAKELEEKKREDDIRRKYHV